MTKQKRKSDWRQTTPEERMGRILACAGVGSICAVIGAFVGVFGLYFLSRRWAPEAIRNAPSTDTSGMLALRALIGAVVGGAAGFTWCWYSKNDGSQ